MGCSGAALVPWVLYRLPSFAVIASSKRSSVTLTPPPKSQLLTQYSRTMAAWCGNPNPTLMLALTPMLS